MKIMQGRIWFIFGILLSCSLQAETIFTLPPPPLWDQVLVKESDHNSNIESQAGPYLLPSDHKIKKTLDSLFQNVKSVQTDKAFIQNGFQMICDIRPFTFVRVARHPLMPGYVFKFYPENEGRKKKNKESWEWLILRCKAVRKIQKFIKEKKFRFITAPKKWVYKYSFGNQHKLRHPLILVAQDMNLVSLNDSERAWRNKTTKQHLNELYTLLSNGYSSCYLSGNIPYTRDGTFSCIDTEHLRRKLNYPTGVKKYFTRELQAYWDKLVKNGKSKKHSHKK